MKVDITPWKHDHTFGQDRKRPGEGRTFVVIGVTATMMIVEIAAGVAFGSMALLADGLHMASHAAALSINGVAYIYARRHAGDPRYSFGTGKVNALGGYTGAILLAVFALLMVWESGDRIISPVEIAFNQAIAVAVIGLIVNGASMLILGHGHDHEDHDHQGHHHHDHNLRAAYLHVLADALTSFLAIFALLAAKYLGVIWMDPLMGFVGAALVFKWSLGLLRTTSRVLLDRQGPAEAREKIRQGLEADKETRVTDLHLWSIGPNAACLIAAVLSKNGKTPDDYKQMLPSDLNLAHVSIEVNHSALEPLA
jgi:cation diffusion facilitator family transporter